MKKILFSILSIFLAYYSINAEMLNVTRNDADTNRSSFVTATYIFSIDLSIDSIRNCYGSNIHISYDQSRYINLSSVRYGDVWDKSASVVIPKVDSATNKGDIIIGVLTNDFANKTKAAQVKIITLEFSVSPNAPHGQVVTFSFPTAQGFVLDSNNDQKVIDLKTTNSSYSIHSFVNVWPGDANNDGLVDVTDITNIGLYLNFGQRHLDSRTFSRQYASTNWTSQRCLAWDSSLVTYADCDGNGEVNINDLLVVPVNFTKRHNIIYANEPKLTDDYKFNNIAGIQIVPIITNANPDIIAFAGSINLSSMSEDFDILGIRKGNLFGDAYTYSTTDPNTNTFIFTSGSYNQSNFIGNSDKMILGYLILQTKSYSELSFNVNYNELKGIDINGNIYDLMLSLSADDAKTADDNVCFRNEKLYFSNIQIEKSNAVIDVFDVLGNKILTQNAEISSGEYVLINNIDVLNSGVYFISVTSDHFNKVIKILKK